MFKHCLVMMVAGACAVFAPVVAPGPPTQADRALSAWVADILSANPEIQAARAAIEAAGGRLRAAGQPLFNPELELEYENSEIDTTAGGISQTIDWSDKRAARTAVSDSRLESARAELLSKRHGLATALLLALADWQTAGAIVLISEKQNMLVERFAHLAEQRRKAGDLGQVELDLAHLAAADAAFELANARENMLRAQQAVAALSGTDEQGWPPFSEQLPDVDLHRVDMERLLKALPSIRVAMARVAAARASVQLSNREKRPDPTVGFRVGKEDSDTLTGVTLSVPLFVRNTYSAEVDVANAELVETEHEAANRWQLARAELLAAARIYRNACHAWKNWEASGAPRLGQRTDLLDRLWQAGEINTTDYLVQLKQALDTEVSAIEQRGRMWQAWAAWLAASGQVDQWLKLAGDN